MKRRIVNFIGGAIMAVAVAFSLIQLRIPVVRAQEGCPAGSQVACGCDYYYNEYDPSTDTTTCHYSCETCDVGGGAPFYIEREYTVPGGPF